jgi:hypothetical protein
VPITNSDEALDCHRTLFWAFAMAFRSAAVSGNMNEDTPGSGTAMPASVVSGQLVSGAQPERTLTRMIDKNARGGVDFQSIFLQRRRINFSLERCRRRD